MDGYVAIPLNVTVRGLLGVPLNPRVILVTLNEQFLKVSDSCKPEQVADVSSLTDSGQFPQSDVMRYCTVEHPESGCDQLNLSSPGLTSARSTTGGTFPHSAIQSIRIWSVYDRH
jgi:hypothetical protein